MDIRTQADVGQAHGLTTRALAGTLPALRDLPLRGQKTGLHLREGHALAPHVVPRLEGTYKGLRGKNAGVAASRPGRYWSEV